MEIVFFSGAPEDSSEFQAGIDPKQEGMSLNLDPLEDPKIKETDPMWSSESSNFDWLFQEG